MGIPGLFAWLRNNCPTLIRHLSRGRSLSQELKQEINTLALDMNGIYHQAVKTVLEHESLVHPSPSDVIKKKIFQECAQIVNDLIYRVRPTEEVLVMVDGPAGSAKQSQQQQRRYRAASDVTRKFDTNCISAGTEWMDQLSKFLDNYIHKQLSLSPIWKNLKIVFSNEKVPGEGEHKLISYIRKYGSSSKTYVFYGLDADLIMLVLGLQNTLTKHMDYPTCYILRNNLQDVTDLLFVSINGFREYILEKLMWNNDLGFSLSNTIVDFIALCFFLGNDFLPHSPSIDLINGGVELLFESYVTACTIHKSYLVNGRTFNLPVLKEIIGYISRREKELLEQNVEEKFADPLLEMYRKKVGDVCTFDFDGYRRAYYLKNFKDTPVQKVVHEYIRGMDWVLRYYMDGIPSWTWRYPYSYSPFMTEMFDHVMSYTAAPFTMGRPMEPFMQLMTILPPKSAHLLPVQLRGLLESFPSDFSVDLSGKKFDWQGVVVVPTLPEFKNKYTELISSIDPRDAKRNRPGRVFVYTYDPTVSKTISGIRGTFISHIKCEILE